MAHPNLTRDEVTRTIKANLRKRSGKAWRCYGHTGTAWGWLTITAPAARLVNGYLSPAEARELADLLGLSDSVHFQGKSVTPDEWESMIARSAGTFRDEHFESGRAAEIERAEREAARKEEAIRAEPLRLETRDAIEALRAELRGEKPKPSGPLACEGCARSRTCTIQGARSTMRKCDARIAAVPPVDEPPAEAAPALSDVPVGPESQDMAPHCEGCGRVDVHAAACFHLQPGGVVDRAAARAGAELARALLPAVAAALPDYDAARTAHAAGDSRGMVAALFGPISRPLEAPATVTIYPAGAIFPQADANA